LRKQRRLRVFENVVLKRIFEPKRNDITGEWRILYIESFMICTQNILFR